MSEATEADVRRALAAVAEAEGQRAFAIRCGIPPSIVSEVLAQKRAMPASLANALGFIELPKRYRKFANGGRA